ncbi:MAG: hypothetical protein RMM17_00845 [Acidobacteriota bacterium]|nr:hypothetical protein [Blastocatellia bacterium]MDW8411215.1 hypothetical protein [Acidobacteriota bacterium]
MFTVEAKVDKTYRVNADTSALRAILTNTSNYPLYMPDIVAEVEKISDKLSLWKLKIDISAGSALQVDLEMLLSESAHHISFKPKKLSNNHLGLDIELRPTRADVELRLILELRLERRSGYEIHPLASVLGERTINRIVRNHAEQYLDEFIQHVARKAG